MALLEVVGDVKSTRPVRAGADRQGVVGGRLVPVVAHGWPEDLDIVCHHLPAIVAVGALVALRVHLHVQEPKDERACA